MQLEEASEEVREVDQQLQRLAKACGAIIGASDQARIVRPAPGKSGIALYPKNGFVALWLKPFWDRGETDVAEGYRSLVHELHPDRQPAHSDPSLPAATLLRQWERAESELLRPYLEARLRHAREPDVRA